MDCSLSGSSVLCPWDSPGKNTGTVSHALLQGIFLTQELNPHLFMFLALAGGFFFTTSTTWETQPYFYDEMTRERDIMEDVAGSVFISVAV